MGHFPRWLRNQQCLALRESAKRVGNPTVCPHSKECQLRTSRTRGKSKGLMGRALSKELFISLGVTNAPIWGLPWLKVAVRTGFLTPDAALPS